MSGVNATGCVKFSVNPRRKVSGGSVPSLACWQIFVELGDLVMAGSPTWRQVGLALGCDMGVYCY